MKSINLNIQNSISNTYDKTKTSISGHVVQRTINGQQVLGPTLTSFIDTQSTAALVPSYTKYNAATGRLFVLSTKASRRSAMRSITATRIARMSWCG